jgi:16S rRNA (adenine(1408)-N(1))-methyltransferase
MNYNLKNLNFEKYFLDIGTGDGRFVYKSALSNPNYLYIGIDPASNLKEYQREINRKRLQNALLINSSIENFKPEVKNFFDQISIILPWGNLLKYTATADKKFFTEIGEMLKNEGTIEIIFGFNEELEEKETKRLNLTELTEKEVTYLKALYENLSLFRLEEFREATYRELENFETSWAKKLSFGKDRKYLKITLKKHLTSSLK